MLRFGILSTATIGKEHVIPAIQSATNANVVGIASRKLSSAKRLAQQCGATFAFGSYDEMLASDDIDAVYIPLPTSHHVEWSIKAANAGKHVLCEKPISLKASDIKKIIKARDKNNVIVSEAYMVTYHPQWMKVRNLLAKGAIGSLRHIDASFTYFNTNPKNMRNIPALGGGALPDIGVYPTVTARFATGLEPKRVHAKVEFDPKMKTDRYASVHAEFPGFDMTFYVSTQMGNRQTMVFHGNKGFIELSAPFNSNLYEGDEVRVHNGSHGETRTYRFTGINQYTMEIEAFAKAAAGRKQHLFSLEESYLNQRVIDAIYRSGKSKRWQSV